MRSCSAEALEESLRLSRDVHAEFKTGQTLLAIALSRKLSGDPIAAELRSEGECVLDRLG